MSTGLHNLSKGVFLGAPTLQGWREVSHSLDAQDTIYVSWRKGGVTLGIGNQERDVKVQALRSRDGSNGAKEFDAIFCME